MPRKAKQRRWNKKQKQEEVKKYKKKQSKIKKISHTKDDGFKYNEYVDKNEGGNHR